MAQERIPRLFPYYGSKHAFSHAYPEPHYNTIIEPFAGSAAYSHRWYDRNVILFDVSGEVRLMWEWLLSVSRREIMTLPVLRDRNDCASNHTTDPTIIRVYSHLVVRSPNRSKSGKPTPFGWGDRDLISCLIRGQRREEYADALDKIRHWKFYQHGYTEIDGIVGNVEATWFVDPPYNNTAGKIYKHNCTGIDFGHLGDWCHARRGQVIVCENLGATWMPFRRLREIEGTAKRSTEAIYHRSEYASALFG